MLPFKEENCPFVVLQNNYILQRGTLPNHCSHVKVSYLPQSSDMQSPHSVTNELLSKYVLASNPWLSSLSIASVPSAFILWNSTAYPDYTAPNIDHNFFEVQLFALVILLTFRN